MDKEELERKSLLRAADLLVNHMGRKRLNFFTRFIHNISHKMGWYGGTIEVKYINEEEFITGLKCITCGKITWM